MSANQAEREAGEWMLAGLAASVLALLLFAWLATQVAEHSTIAFDASVRDFVHRHSSPALTELMLFLTWFGEPGVLFILGAAVFIGMAAAGWRTSALAFLITMIGALVLDATLKSAFHRSRPVSFFGTPEPASYSFPSGHALFAVCYFGSLAALLSERTTSNAKRAVIWILAVFFAFMIGFSRVYLGVHYPSDVLGGYAAAVIWVGAVAHGENLLLRRRKRARGES